MTATEFLEKLDYMVINNLNGLYDIYQYGYTWEALTPEQLEGFARARGWEYK